MYPQMARRYVVSALGIAATIAVAVLAVHILRPAEEPASWEKPHPSAALETKIPPESVRPSPPSRVALMPGEARNPQEDPRVAALLDTADPLERRYRLREILKDVHSREDFDRLGLTAAMLECEDPERAGQRMESRRVYDILSLLTDSNEPWVREYVEELAHSSDAAAIAQAVLFAHDDESWAQQALEGVYANLRTQEGMPWQFLDFAAQTATPWSNAFYLREYQAAAPETRAEWARQNMLSEYRHLSAENDVRQTAFLMALRDPDPVVQEGAVAFLLDESHLVHPNGAAWSAGLLMDAFNEGDSAERVALVEAARNILLSRLEAENIAAQLGNTTAINTLLQHALASPENEVRTAAQETLATMESAIDVAAARAELASFVLELRQLTRQLR